MVIEETWGVSLQRCRSFFSSQPDVACHDAECSFLEARITLTELSPGSLGNCSLPRTLLRIEGPETDVKTIYRRFFLQFLSAGG